MVFSHSLAKSCLTLQPHGLQHTRFPCTSLSSRICLLRLMSTESVMPSNHLILCCPLLVLPSIFPLIRVFSNEPALCIRWPKYWSFSFSISPSNEYSGLISFRIHQFDLLVIQGILKSPLQCHNLKASILWCSAFFTIHLSHLYMITGKTRALTIWTFVSKMRSLLFKMLSSINNREGDGTPLQYSCLENPWTEGGA